jgi:cell division protease FtsH
VGNPDLKGREAILRVHTRKIQVEERWTCGRSRAARPGSRARTWRTSSTRRRCSPRAPGAKVTDHDLSEARDKVLMGVERRSVVLSEMDRVNCAYHEAGHAVVAALLPKATRCTR